MGMRDAIRCRCATNMFYAAGGGERAKRAIQHNAAGRHRLKRIPHGARRIAATQMLQKPEHAHSPFPIPHFPFPDTKKGAAAKCICILPQLLFALLTAAKYFCKFLSPSPFRKECRLSFSKVLLFLLPHRHHDRDTGGRRGCGGLCPWPCPNRYGR